MLRLKSLCVPAASIVLSCCLPAVAGEANPPATEPSPSQLRQLILTQSAQPIWTVDHSLSELLSARYQDATAQRLSGRVLLRLDPVESQSAGAAAPATPSTLQGYLTLDLQPQCVDTLQKIRLNTTTTQPYDGGIGLLTATSSPDSNVVYQLTLDMSGSADQKTAYLGIGVESPGEALRSQLSLPDGAGLVVNYVAQDGPSKNNVQVHDVLQKFDDQILVNAEQLVTLVHMHKPGDSVTLTLLRKASPRTEQITLGQKQNAESPKAASPSAVQGLGEIPYLGRLYSTDIEPRPITFNDGELLASIDSHGDLLAIDVKSGQQLFHGPFASKQQWESVPEAVRSKLAAWRNLIAIHEPAEKH
jgi:hypothetical protein